jgi:type IV pilus biogenesis protein PilP
MRLLADIGPLGRALGWIGIAGLLASLLAFVPSIPGLFQALQPTPVPQVQTVTVAPLREAAALEAHEVLTRRPLFTAGRRPDPVTAPPGAPVDGRGAMSTDPTQYRLVGIAGDSVERLALVRKADGEIVTVRTGDSLDGWTVDRIDTRGVSISGGGLTELLAIPAAVNGAPTP